MRLRCWQPSRRQQRLILLICSPGYRRSRRKSAGYAVSAMRARPLDLDIIAMGEAGEMVRIAPDPVLPHPRAHLRAFVLVPLLEVAPGWVHPLLRHPAKDLLRDLPQQGICPL